MSIYQSEFTKGKGLRELRLMAILLLEKKADLEGMAIRNIPSGGGNEGNFLSIESGMYELNLLKAILENAVRQIFSTLGAISEFAKEIENTKSETLVDNNKFSWLKDKGAGYWLWCYMRQESSKVVFNLPRAPAAERMVFNPFDSFKTKSEYFNFLPQFYNLSGLVKQPNDFNEIFNAIVGFFDHWLVRRSDKEDLLDKLKIAWSSLYDWETENGKPFSFLKKNDSEGIEWCWEYFKAKVKTINWEQFQPATSLERYHYIFGIFYAWESTPEARKLFLMEINRAWSQRKFRAAQGNKKAFQTYMKDETKERLLELAEKNGLKINEALDKIINDAYTLMLNLSDDD